MSCLKHLFLLLLLSFFCGYSAAFAQSHGYIVQGDTAYSDGYIRFNPRKPQEVEYRTIKKSDPKIFNSEQLSAFGYRDSTKYESREVLYFGQKQKVFLQIIAEGDLNLFLMQNRKGRQFYAEKDTLIQLHKENLAEDLKRYNGNCPDLDWQLKRVRLSKPSLAHYGRALNSGRCTSIPFLSFGLATTLNLTTFAMEADAYADNKFGKYSMTSENAEAGIFAEVPGWGINHLSFVNQLSYGKLKFSKAHTNAAFDQDVKLDLELLKFSFRPKYSYYLRRMDLFAEAGPEVLYVTEQSGQLLHASRTDTEIQIEEPSDFLQMPEWQHGFTAGAGVVYYYTPKQYISLGIYTGYTFGRYHTISNLSTTLRINL